MWTVVTSFFFLIDKFQSYAFNDNVKVSLRGKPNSIADSQLSHSMSH